MLLSLLLRLHQARLVNIDLAKLIVVDIVALLVSEVTLSTRRSVRVQLLVADEILG